MEPLYKQVLYQYTTGAFSVGWIPSEYATRNKMITINGDLAKVISVGINAKPERIINQMSRSARNGLASIS